MLDAVPRIGPRKLLLCYSIRVQNIVNGCVTVAMNSDLIAGAVRRFTAYESRFFRNFSRGMPEPELYVSSAASEGL